METDKHQVLQFYWAEMIDFPNIWWNRSALTNVYAGYTDFVSSWFFIFLWLALQSNRTDRRNIQVMVQMARIGAKMFWSGATFQHHSAKPPLTPESWPVLEIHTKLKLSNNFQTAHKKTPNLNIGSLYEDTKSQCRKFIRQTERWHS